MAESQRNNSCVAGDNYRDRSVKVADGGQPTMVKNALLAIVAVPIIGVIPSDRSPRKSVQSESKMQMQRPGSLSRAFRELVGHPERVQMVERVGSTVRGAMRFPTDQSRCPINTHRRWL